jgi:hypothetical protein
MSTDTMSMEVGYVFDPIKTSFAICGGQGSLPMLKSRSCGGVDVLVATVCTLSRPAVVLGDVV